MYSYNDNYATSRIMCNMQTGTKSPQPTNRNVQSFISMLLNIPETILEFVAISEPFSDQQELRHACKFSLLQLESMKVTTVPFYDTAVITFAYCPHCYKVLYYIDK